MIRVVTDSTCDLPREAAARCGITVLPLYVNINGRGYLDGVDITREQFFRDLPGYRGHPSTAAPSLQRFVDLYRSLAEEGASAVISIHVAGSLSAICDVARAAAAELAAPAVTVFDSRQISLGLGFMAESAARLAQAGASLGDILAALQRQAARTYVAAGLDTLEYLRRSGRVNGLLSSIGGLLQIKPLLKLYDGVIVSERARTRRHALRRLVELLQTRAPLERAAVLHSGARAEAEAFLAEIRDLLPDGETWLELINPVLGAHLGPGAVGFAALSREQR